MSTKTIDGVEHKDCPKCWDTLPVSEFYRNSGRSDGYSSYCKSCTKEKANERNSETRDVAKIRKIRKRAKEGRTSVESLLDALLGTALGRELCRRIERGDYSERIGGCGTRAERKRDKLLALGDQ